MNILQYESKIWTTAETDAAELNQLANLAYNALDAVTTVTDFKRATTQTPRDALCNAKSTTRAYREREPIPSGYSVQAAVTEFGSLHRELMKTRTCEPLQPTEKRRALQPADSGSALLN